MKRAFVSSDFIRAALVAIGVAFLASHCGGSTASNNLGDAGLCEGTAHGPTSAPAGHRATASACPKTLLIGLDSGTPIACNVDTDCRGDAGNQYPQNLEHCLQHQCGVDSCLVDADCPSSQVCSCAGTLGGGGQNPGNACVPASCHVDSDCPAGGYCAPSRISCNTLSEFDCTSAADSCVDPQTDCKSCGGYACLYDPMVGHFVCQTSVCHG
jgi:hypothetical protein